MDFSFLASWYWPAGMLIGFAAAAPLGPVNMLVIQRCLQRGFRSALAVATGAMLGDIIFAAAAIFGLAALRSLIDENGNALRLLGGLFMIGFGLLLWRQSPHLDNAQKALPPPMRVATAILVMTLTNPATLFWFFAAVAAFRFRDIGHASMAAMSHSALLLAGVAAGALLWWLLLCGFARSCRHLVDDRHLRQMNHAVSILLIIFGSIAIASLI